MTLEEAEALYNTPWLLPCGHKNTDIKSDYYDSWCGKCGIKTNKIKPPESYATALKIINEDYNAKRHARNVITEQVEIDIKRFLKYNPYGTIEEFYNYIITTK
jgi:hypothetical protein